MPSSTSSDARSQASQGTGDGCSTEQQANAPEYSAGDMVFINRFIDAVRLRIKNLGFEVKAIDDFVDLSKHLKTNNATVNPTFDPNENEIRDGFWLKVTNSSGQIIACHAERIFHSNDFISEFIETGRLWWSNREDDPKKWRDEIISPRSAMAGTIAYAGSMLINEGQRGIGLSLYLPYLSRALCMKHFRTNFHVGIVRENLSRSKVPGDRYGFPNVDKVFRGILPGVRGPAEDVFLCWMNYRDAMNTLKQSAHHSTFPVIT
jgi:hypothetical protein